MLCSKVELLNGKITAVIRDHRLRSTERQLLMICFLPNVWAWSYLICSDQETSTVFSMRYVEEGGTGLSFVLLSIQKL